MCRSALGSTYSKISSNYLFSVTIGSNSIFNSSSFSKNWKGEILAHYGIAIALLSRNYNRRAWYIYVPETDSEILIYYSLASVNEHCKNHHWPFHREFSSSSAFIRTTTFNSNQVLVYLRLNYKLTAII